MSSTPIADYALLSDRHSAALVSRHRCIPFHEYFHSDTGAGLGASHQTGWTGLSPTLYCAGKHKGNMALGKRVTRAGDSGLDRGTDQAGFRPPAAEVKR